MSEPVTARQRAQDRKEALLDGPVVSEGMTLGSAQVYIGMRNGEWSLYRSPDGRKVVWLEGDYATPREAINAAKEQNLW